MSGGKETPRQKMIGMMYLVLTALLALNVSKDILEAFVQVNEGIVRTTSSFEKKNVFMYEQFSKNYDTDPGKVGKFYDKAKLIREESNKLYKYIGDLKALVIATLEKIPQAQADTIHLKYVKGKDNQDVPGNILVGLATSKGKGFELKDKIIAYKKLVSQTLTDVGGGNVDLGLNTDDPKGEAHGGHQLTWVSSLFEHTPSAAVITLLSKLQSDVRNAEANSIDFLFSRIDAATFKFDSLRAVVIPSSNYVIKGTEFTAEIFLSAFSTTLSPKITANGGAVKVENGIGKYQTVPNTEGEIKWGGIISIVGPDGKEQPYKFESKYVCAPAAVTISPTKMNVLYIGPDNPISISVPGIDPSKLKATISQGTLIKKNGSDYIAQVTKQGRVQLTVDAELNGKMQRMGVMEFRVKFVPNPVAKVNNQTDGGITRSDLLAQSAVIPLLENFDFELFFQVTSFTMVKLSKGRDPERENSTTNRITPAMKDIIKNARIGDIIIFEAIRAKGPDGNPRALNPVSLTLI